MNNQAAQTMPELPDSQYRGGNDVFGKEFPLYTADQMHQYARDYVAALSQTAGVAREWTPLDIQTFARAYKAEVPGAVLTVHGIDAGLHALAAAPAASGGEVWTREMIADVHKRGEELFQRINHPSAASASERARELLATEYDKIGLNGAATYIRSGQHGELDKAIIRAIEQALTQQRDTSPGESGGVDEPYDECYSIDGDSWVDSPADAIFVDGLSVGDTYKVVVSHYSIERTYVVTKAPDETSDDYEVRPVNTTPQPSVDAVREVPDGMEELREKIEALQEFKPWAHKNTDSRKGFVTSMRKAKSPEEGEEYGWVNKGTILALLSAASGEKGVWNG